MKHKRFLALNTLAAIIAASVLLTGCDEIVEGTNDTPADGTSISQSQSSYISENSSEPKEDNESSSEFSSSKEVSSSVSSTFSSSESSSYEASESSSSASSSVTDSTAQSTSSSSKASSASSTTQSVKSSSSSSKASSVTQSAKSSSSSSKASSATQSIKSSSSSSKASSTAQSTKSSSSSSKASSTQSTKSSSSSSKASSKTQSSSDDGSFTVDIVPGGLAAPNYAAEDIYSILISFKEKYPEGTPWTNGSRVYRSYTIAPEYLYFEGRGCAAFAFELSDTVFGDLPRREHKDISKVRVGDILRINNDTHSVIVLEVRSDGVIIAEGNYNSSVHWGRLLTYENLEKNLTYIWTRYPK